eukprot:TRINITY_DN10432_c0_g3_i2.p1 TRINITY_DN10432_c0_g3~~TRINITY_DN10432_c0_g3_i2.p1  ORF type:complete len:600 (+),score=121.98 TRINITY_DN10432_c0_g3_i2:28-1800(+)
MSMRNIVDGRCARCYQPAHAKCARCKQRAYCTSVCQTKDWKLGHKFNCGRDATHDVVSDRPIAPSESVFAADRAAELHTQRSEQKQFEGLVNIQNTCYINSVVQCVAAVPGLYRGLVESLTETNVASSASLALTSFVSCVAGITGRPLPPTQQALPLAPPLAQIQTGSDVQAIVPMNLVTCLVQLSAEMSFGAQEDAHELYQVLIRSLSKAIVAEQTLRPLNRETTIVDQLFTSTIASQLLCPECKYKAVSFERQIDLQLEIEEYTDTLEEMLEAFTCPERLDAKNKWKCPSCYASVRAHKQLSVFEAPNVLAIQLKRFRLGTHGRVGKYITYPNNLNLKNYMTPGSPDTDSLEYELFGIVIHLTVGNLTTFGHYVSVVKGCDGQWRIFDDQEVTPIDSDSIAKTTPYMLFYRRKTFRKMTIDPSSEAGGPAVSAGAASASAAKAQPAAGMCIGNCGFYGSPEMRGYCSKCFKSKNIKPLSQEEIEAMQTPSTASNPDASAEHKDSAAAESEASDKASSARDADESAADAPKAIAKPSRAQSVKAAPSKPAGITKKGVASDDKAKSSNAKIGRNDPCPCGSGRKYKKCHG